MKAVGVALGQRELWMDGKMEDEGRKNEGYMVREWG